MVASPKMDCFPGRILVTTPIAERDPQQLNRPAERPQQPAFKPVALPALAAAVQAASLQSPRPRPNELPAILRKEAMMD